MTCVQFVHNYSNYVTIMSSLSWIGTKAEMNSWWLTISVRVSSSSFLTFQPMCLNMFLFSLHPVVLDYFTLPVSDEPRVTPYAYCVGEGENIALTLMLDI